MLITLSVTLAIVVLGTPVAFAFALTKVLAALDHAQEQATNALEQAANTAARSILTPSTALPGGVVAPVKPLGVAYDGVTWQQDDTTMPDDLDMTDVTLPNPEWLRPVGLTVTDGSDSPFGIPGFTKDPERYAGHA